MALIITGIPVTEFKESGRLEMDLDGALTGERIYDVSGIDNIRVGLIFGLLGYPHIKNELIKRSKPHRFGDVPELYCTHVETVGFSKLFNTGEDQSIRHEWYRVRAIYSTPPYEVEGKDSWLEEYMDFSGEFMPLGEGRFKWKDGDPIDQNIGKIIGGVDRTWVLHNVKKFDREATMLNLGKINDDKFQGSKEGTLLFMGATVSRQNQPSGSNRPWEIALKFKERAHHWNHEYRTDTGKWEPMVPERYEETKYAELIVNVDPP